MQDPRASDDRRLADGFLDIFLRIGIEIDEPRDSKLLRHAMHALLPYEMQFILAPLCRVQLLALKDRDKLARRLVLSAEQEITLIHPVYGAIGGDVGPRQLDQRGENVHFVQHFITHAARWNFTRPADDERDAHRAL